MRTHLVSIGSVALAMAAFPAMAVDTTMTPAGYTGLGVTPNAHLLGWGRFEATYDTHLIGIRNASGTGHNIVGAVGLLPNLEIAGRLAATRWDNPCFVAPGCGVRDLSASGKIGIGLDQGGRFKAAVGFTDVGGAVTYFRTFYGVTTYDNGPLEVSAGLAKRSGRSIGGSRSPLSGPFAAAAWQPVPWMRAHLEYADKNAWVGLRFFSPQQWLPEGWAAYVGANQSLTNSGNATKRSWWTAGMSIPLYKVPDLPGNAGKAPLPMLTSTQQPAPQYEARVLPPATMQAPNTAVVTPSAPPSAPSSAINDATPAQLESLAAGLRDKGLEDVHVGRLPDRTVAVRVENRNYNWNSVDAVGAALGAIARALGDSPVNYRLVVTQRNLPLVGITGQTNCLREWLANSQPTCTAGQLVTPGSGQVDTLLMGVVWDVRPQDPAWKALRLTLSPVLRTSIGTELGALDYAMGINVGLQIPLWTGAIAELRQDVPVSRSEDYQPGRIFAHRRIRSGVERAALTQTLRLPAGWSGLTGLNAQASVGRFGMDYDGITGALRWEPGEGRHRVTVQTGWFRNSNPGLDGNLGPRNSYPTLASYRYNVAATRTYLEATGGQFMNNDRGLQLGLRQWFSDVSMQAYYKRTKNDTTPTRQIVGLEVTVPIGPRRDTVALGPLRLTGTPRFSHAVETSIRDGATNPIRPGVATIPPTPQLDSTFNSDRASLLYFEDNMRRIRDAARQP